MRDEGFEDRRVVRRMLAGDEHAFSEFFSSYFPPLYRFALARLGGDADLAEEVVQRALCNAIDQAHTWRGEAQLLTWLCAICRREIAGHFRKVSRTPSRVELTEDMPEVRAALESMRGGEGDPERQACSGEISALVHVTLDFLPPRYARVLELKYLEGYSMKEIAVELGATPKAVESLLTRARNAFRDVLAPMLEGFAAHELHGGTR